MKFISSDSACSKTSAHIFWNSEKIMTETSQIKNPKRGVSKPKRTGREKVEKSRLEGFSGIPKTILRRSCESRKSLCQPSTVSGTFLQRVSHKCITLLFIDGNGLSPSKTFEKAK